MGEFVRKLRLKCIKTVTGRSADRNQNKNF